MRILAFIGFVALVTTAIMAFSIVMVLLEGRR